jgi:hypothetical protein
MLKPINPMYRSYIYVLSVDLFCHFAQLGLGFGWQQA